MSSSKNQKQILEEIEKSKEKLTTLFYEMLDFKHKEHNKNMSFEDLLNLTSIHYNYCSYLFKDAYWAVKYGKEYVLPSVATDNPFYNAEEEATPLSNAQILETLTILYNELTEKGNDYKKHANDDEDIDLSGGKTLKELAKEYENRFVPLFQEMLDTEKVPYDAKKQNDFSSLYLCVSDAYPWYHDLLFHLHYQISTDLDSSYVDIINACAISYRRLKNYKKERDAFYQEHSDIIEAHKKWLKKKTEVEKCNEEVRKKREPFAKSLDQLYKEARKAKRAHNTRNVRKFMKQIEEIEKMLNEKYPFSSIDSDPYNKIKYQNCFDDFDNLDEEDWIP